MPVIVRWTMPQVCPKRPRYLTGAGRLRSRHSDVTVRVQGERGPQVLDGPLRSLRHPDRRQPTRRLPVAHHPGGPLSPQGIAADRAEAAAEVSDALDELARQNS
jgi:hypothetical protein